MTYANRLKSIKFNRELMILIMPALLVLMFTTIFPFIYCIWISLHNVVLFYPVPIKFVGLGNFIESLFNPIYGFWRSAYTTLIFTGSSLAIEFLLGLGIALLLNKEFKGVWILRFLLVIPLLISPVSVGLLFRLMFLPGDWALINWVLSSLFQIPPINWLGEPTLAMLVLIITDIWEWTPFLALIFLAGLQVLPPEPFEAALIEGASPIKIFRYITIPMLKDLLAIAFLLRLMDSLKTYDIIYIITQGGPGEATQTLNFNAYVQGFIFGNISIAAAQMLMMTIATILLTVILVRLTRERV